MRTIDTQCQMINESKIRVRAYDATAPVPQGIPDVMSQTGGTGNRTI